MRFPLPGEEFEGKYRIESVLGSGGFARVYKAWECGLERHVALKILRPPALDGQSADERDQYLATVILRFKMEGQLLSRLRSPHTVTLYSFGETSDGLLYMALEFIDGLSLAQFREDGRSLDPARVIKILRQVLLSLNEAHAMGMLHRDLKPANIMVFEYMGDPDQVKLLDFGIAKTFGESTSKNLTSDGTLIGTPRYMSPEQLQGNGSAAPSSDIYSLGLVAFELLTGERAIKTDNSLQVIGQQMGPVSFTVPTDLGLPPLLRGVVNQMIDKNQGRRYQAVSEVLEDLSRPGILSLSLSEPATMKLDAIQLASLTEESLAPVKLVVELEKPAVSIKREEPPDPDYVSPLELPKDSPRRQNRFLMGLALVLSLLLIGLVSLIWARRGHGVETENIPNLDGASLQIDEEEKPSQRQQIVADEEREQEMIPLEEEGVESAEVLGLEEAETIDVPNEPVRRKKRKRKKVTKTQPEKFEPKVLDNFPMVE